MAQRGGPDHKGNLDQEVGLCKRSAKTKKVVFAKHPGGGPGDKGKAHSKAGLSDQDRMARTGHAHARREERG